VASGNFAGAAMIAAGVGKLYQKMEHDPRWADMPQTQREAIRRRERLADLAVHWENRRRLSAIQPAVEAHRRAGAAACVAATKAAAAATLGQTVRRGDSGGDDDDEDVVRPFVSEEEETAAAAGGLVSGGGATFGRVSGRPRGPIPDSALRALESAAEGFAWVGAWVEANPDLQGLADWVPTPGQVVADRAKVERARLQCLCGAVEHFADAAAEAVRRQPFDDAARLARATEPLDKAASSAAAARAAAKEARRALDASVSSLPADDRVRVACSQRVALAGAGAEDTIAAVAAARARFDFQVGAATTMSTSKAAVEVGLCRLNQVDP
jgi:hypothetical protein